MKQYIDKGMVKAEIERRKNQFISQAESFRKIGMEDKESYFAALASNMNSLSCFIDSLDDKCDGCNNIKGCVTCKDGSEWAHYQLTKADIDSAIAEVEAKAKAFTSLEQSKKLAKILPIESADMSWVSNGLGKPFARTIPIKGDPEELCGCWSLAALLSILKPINGNTYTIYGTLDGSAMITFEEVTCAFHEKEIIDAVYRMVLWLNEQNIL